MPVHALIQDPISRWAKCSLLVNKLSSFKLHFRRVRRLSERKNNDKVCTASLHISSRCFSPSHIKDALREKDNKDEAALLEGD